MTFTPRDAKDVSNLVAKKLELYMNVERREDRFDPQGYLRTTPKMKTLDLMYQMLDKAELDGKSKSSSRERKNCSPRDKTDEPKGRKSSRDKQDDDDNRKEGCSDRGKIKKKEKQKSIRPKLVDNSRRVVPKKEADRITLTVNKIFEEQDLDRLHVIHRYRPHSPDVAALTENGKVLGYTRHVGSALHGDHYVDFYLKEGLQTGKAEHSRRLQRLKEGKEKSDTKSSKSAGRDSSSMKSQETRHDWATKSRMRDILSPLASSTSCESVSSAGASGRRTPSSQQPVYTTFLSSTPMSSRASAGQALESKLGYKVLSRIEDGKSAGYVGGGRGEGDQLAREKWEVGCRDVDGERRVDDDDNDVMGAGSVSARQESRADLASSEDYCKFSTGKDTSCVSESRQDRESDISKGHVNAVGENEDDTPKVSNDPIYLRDVQMSYKRYRNPDSGFVLTGLGAAEISPRGMSGLVSARSTQSEPAKPSRRRSVRSRNNLPPEMSPFPTTVSEDGSSTTRTICSSSMISSTPRRALSHREPIKPTKTKDKDGSQPLEPIRALLETPDVPRLGLTSDLNDTNRSLFSNGRNEPVEDYTTAEQMVRQHPDTRASEGHVSSRAGERDTNKDGRAEEKCFEDIQIKEAGAVGLQESMTDDDKLAEINIHQEASALSAGIMGSCTQKENENHDVNTVGGIENDRQSVSSRSSKGSKNSKSKSRKYQQVTSDSSHVQTGDRKSPTIEIERGEDEGRNTELDRGHETAGSNTGMSRKEKKQVIERGDDLSETLQEESRLSQSARKRGQSGYRTTTKSERGIEREYFTPQAHQTEQYIIPVDEEMEDSLLDASQLNSRPSSAVSSETSQVSVSKRKKKSLRRFSKTSDGGASQNASQKEPVKRPTSAVSRDGRGDDSHSVASRPGTSCSKTQQAPVGDGKEQRPTSATSQGSQKSQITAKSVSSRGSVNGKDRPGKNHSYHVANAESIDRGLDENPLQTATEMIAEVKTQSSENMRPQNPANQPSNVAEIETIVNNEERVASENVNETCHDENGVQTNDSKVSRAESARSDKKHEDDQPFQKEEVPVLNEQVDPKDKSKNEPDNNFSETSPQKDVSDQMNKGERENGKEMVPERQKSSSPTNGEEVIDVNQGGIVLNNVINGSVKHYAETENLRSNQLGAMEVNSEGLEKSQNCIPDEQAPMKDDSPSDDIAPQEKAFIDSSDTTEIVKAPVSASVSLDADKSVIDFRPSSASTAKSFSADHENGTQQATKDKQRTKTVQPSRIVEVTESEGTPTPGRDTHRAFYNNNEIIQTNYVLPTQAGRDKQAADTERILDLAKIAAQPQLLGETEVLHPGMKKRDSKGSIKSKNSASEENGGDKDYPGSIPSEEKADQVKNISQNQSDVEAQKERGLFASSYKSTNLDNLNEISPSENNEKIHSNEKDLERPLSASSKKSDKKGKVDERTISASQKSVNNGPPFAVNQESAETEQVDKRPPSVSNQVNVNERPPSASSQRSVEKVKVDEKPPSASNQKSVEKMKIDERPPSASSQKSAEKVKIDERPPSASSQKSAKKVKIDERPPSASSQKSAEKVEIDERPPSASSQKSAEKVKVNERPPSASSQKSVEKVKVNERPPSASSQKSAEKVKVITEERPPSASSQKSAEKMKVNEILPSVTSQKSAVKVNVNSRPPSALSQQSVEKVKVDERPPSASIKKSVENVKVDEKPSSESSQNLAEKVKVEERRLSGSSQKSVEKVKAEQRPSSATSQKSVENVKVEERRLSGSSQKSVEKVKVHEGQTSASSQNLSENVKVEERRLSVSSQKSAEKEAVEERSPSISNQVTAEKVEVSKRPPSASSQKSAQKVKVDERPPSASSQKSAIKVEVIERPPSASSQKSAQKVKVDERPPSASSQKSAVKVEVIERPPSASSQKSAQKVKVDERPPSASSQKSDEKVKVEERPLSASSQKSDEKVKVDERPPSASSQKSIVKVEVIERPPSASSQKSAVKVEVIERPPSASSQKSAQKVKVDERPPSASSQKSDEKVKVEERPLSASSQKSDEKVKVDERPPSASSQKSIVKVEVIERPPSASSQKSAQKVKVDERPPSASSQKSSEKVKVEERPPSASSQKSDEKVKVAERPPSASSQKSDEKVKVEERPPSASSQKSAVKVEVIERPPSASSQKSDEKVKVAERPPSASSQKSAVKVEVIERPSSASSQKSDEKVKVAERPPSASSQKSIVKVEVIERPPSASSQKSIEKDKM